MDRATIESMIMKMVTEDFGHEGCTSDMDVMDEIGCASIEIMEMFAWTEKTFNVKISPRDMRMMSTLDDLIDLVEKRIG